LTRDETTNPDAVTVNDYVDVVRRRKWFIFLVALLVFLVGIVLIVRQDAAYSATARAIVPQTSTTPSSTAAQLQRSPEAEASLARQPAIAAAVIRVTDADLSTEEFLTNSTVKADAEADLLEFTVKAESAALAVELANSYANEFDRYRAQVARDLFETARARISAALDGVEAELEAARTETEGLSTTEALLTQQYQELLEEQQRTLSTQTLLSSSLVAIPAERAIQARTHPLRIVLLALAFGLVLGTILAFVREAIDPHVRSADEIGDRLGLPLLARIPRPPRHLGLRNRMVMLENPASPHAEPFRVLRTNLDFANASFGGRTVLFAGASEGDGRSTMLANLGIALARSGRAVMLADLDLRRPRLGPLFGLADHVGVTDVALKRVDLDDALERIDLTDLEPRHGGAEGDRAWDEIEGELHVLPAGSAPADPGDLVGTQALADLLHELGGRSDFVLLDSPPLLSFADGVALSARVDAMIVVVRLHVRRPELDELRRVLDVCPPAKLGYVLTELQPETLSARGSRPAVPAPTSEEPAWVETAER
jgi:polysaccharide biosynthesis transport protein